MMIQFQKAFVWLSLIGAPFLMPACGGSQPNTYETRSIDFQNSHPDKTEELDYDLGVSLIDRTMFENGCWKNAPAAVLEYVGSDRICFTEFVHEGHREPKDPGLNLDAENQSRYHPVHDRDFRSGLAEANALAENAMLDTFHKYFFGHRPSQYYVYGGNKALFIVNGQLGTTTKYEAWGLEIKDKFISEFYVIGNLEFSKEKENFQAKMISLPNFAFDSFGNSVRAGLDMPTFLNLTNKATRRFQEHFLPQKPSYQSFLKETLIPNLQPATGHKQDQSI